MPFAKKIYVIRDEEGFLIACTGVDSFDDGDEVGVYELTDTKLKTVTHQLTTPTKHTAPAKRRKR